MELQIGDEVQVKKEGCIRGSRPSGYRGTITQIGDYYDDEKDKVYFLDDGNGVYKDDLIINNNKPMNIKEKFILAITPEPKKSFRKSGITDGDDILTEEGAKVFLTWLLHNIHSTQFKKEVVDDILKEKKKEEKGE